MLVRDLKKGARFELPIGKDFLVLKDRSELLNGWCKLAVYNETEEKNEVIELYCIEEVELI